MAVGPTPAKGDERPESRESETDEEYLEGDEAPAFAVLATIKDRITTFQRAVAEEKDRRADPHFIPKYPLIAKLVQDNMRFELLFGIIIVLNCFAIAWRASKTKPPDPSGAPVDSSADSDAIGFIIESLFTMVFLIEAVLRILVYGWTWCLLPGNAADLFLVFGTGVIALWILPLAGINSTVLRNFTVLRIFRLIRLARSVRLMPQFKEMWLLIRGLIDSMRMLVWTYVIIAGVLYVFALASTELIGNNSDFVDDPIVQHQFGSVFASMLTLFQIMTLDSWTSVARPLMVKQQWTGWFIFFFISIAVFVLMNLITAVIVENAFAISKADDEEQAKIKQAQQEQDMQELTDLFMDLDVDRSGTLSRAEFEAATAHPMIRRKFQMLDFGIDELDSLWSILDDGDGQLSVEEFSLGIRKMKGEAKAKDIMLCVKAMRMTEGHMNALDERIGIIQQNTWKIDAEVVGVATDLNGLFATCRRLQEAVTRAASTAQRLAPPPKPTETPPVPPADFPAALSATLLPDGQETEVVPLPKHLGSRPPPPPPKLPDSFDQLPGQLPG